MPQTRAASSPRHAPRHPSRAGASSTLFGSALRTVSVLAYAAAIGSMLAGCNQFKSAEMVRANALTLSTQGRYSEALPLYEEVVERRNANAQAHYELGKNLLELDRAGQAREQMILAYNLEPDNQAYLTGLADAFVAAGDEDQLIELLNQRIEDQGQVTDYLRLGRYAQQIGHIDEAERAYLAAADIDGGQTVEPQEDLAGFYRSIGDTPNEITRLRMVLWFDPAAPAVELRLRELGQIPGPSFVLEPTGRE